MEKKGRSVQSLGSLLIPSYDEMGKKPKASSEEDYVVIFIFLFYFLFILGFKDGVGWKSNV